MLFPGFSMPEILLFSNIADRILVCSISVAAFNHVVKYHTYFFHIHWTKILGIKGGKQDL